MAVQSSYRGDQALSTESQYAFDLFCDFCDENGLHLEAMGYCVDCSDYLCCECLKTHPRTRATKNHRVLDKTEMPKSKPTIPPTPTVPRYICKDVCTQHPGEIVKYYCKTHKILGCSVCITMDHRVCTDVDHIPDVAPRLLESHQYKQFIAELGSLKTKSETVIKASNTNRDKTKQCSSNAMKSIKELRKNVIATCDKLERDITTMRKEDLDRMKSVSEMSGQVLNDVEAITADLHHLQSSDQLCQAFVKIVTMEKKIQNFHSTLEEAQSLNSVRNFKFEPSLSLQQILDPTSVGKITFHSNETASKSQAIPKAEAMNNVQDMSDITSLASSTAIPEATAATEPNTAHTVAGSDVINSMKITATRLTAFTARTGTDKNYRNITGSVMLPDNQLILTDSDNNKVKVIDLKTTKVTSELTTPSDPWDITAVPDDQVAITLPNSKKVVFVKVTRKLRLARQMSVNGVCHGVAYGHNNLYVTFESPVKLEIMSLEGQVSKVIDTDSKGAALFKFPWGVALSLDSKTIYVSDYKDNCVKGVSVDGTLQSEYRSRLIGPTGLTVDHCGNVLVCGRGSDNIHIINDGTQGEVLVDGLLWPQSVSYCQNTERLYVGRRKTRSGLGFDITVYQLST